MTVAEFLAFAAARPGEKWELVNGRPVAMAGGTVRHATISANIAEALGPAARRQGCRVLRDPCVSVAANDHQLFDPEVMICCGPADETALSIDDPVAIFEVLSPSTMANDRGAKMVGYITIPALRFIALVYTTEQRVEVWARGDGDRRPEAPTVLARPGAVLSIEPVAFDLPIEAIYDGASPATE